MRGNAWAGAAVCSYNCVTSYQSNASNARREQLIRVFSTSFNFEIQKIARAPLWLSIFGVWVPGAVFSLLDPVLLSLLREEGREASSKVVVFVL